jgi:hypothetical protein
MGVLRPVICWYWQYRDPPILWVFMGNFMDILATYG